MNQRRIATRLSLMVAALTIIVLHLPEIDAGVAGCRESRTASISWRSRK